MSVRNVNSTSPSEGVNFFCLIHHSLMFTENVKKMIEWESNICHRKKCSTTCHTVPLMPLHRNSGYRLKYYIKRLILHMPGHQLYSLGHAPPSWVGLGKWPHGSTPKITLCNICTTCSNLAWECHVWQVVPVVHTIKTSAVKLWMSLHHFVFHCNISCYTFIDYC